MIDNVKRHSDYSLHHNSDMEELKDRLISARKEKKFSQDKLAKAIGVNQSVIGSLESGYRKTSAYIPAIANVLGVEALWLSDGKLPKYKTNIPKDPNTKVYETADPQKQRIIEMIFELGEQNACDFVENALLMALGLSPNPKKDRRTNEDRRHKEEKQINESSKKKSSEDRRSPAENDPPKKEALAEERRKTQRRRNNGNSSDEYPRWFKPH